MANNTQTATSPDDRNDLTTSDGRKIISFSAGGESYGVESTEQAAHGRKAEIEAEIEELKLLSLRRGIRRVKM
jgi:hypothetical protein